MKIEEAIALVKGTPLSDVVGVVNPDNWVGKSLYRIGEEIYLFASPLNPKTLELDPAGPVVTGVYVCPDTGAARRVSTQAFEEDSGKPLTAPALLLPDGVAATYGEILEGLKKTAPKACMETGEYRFKDGKFVHRKIETEKYRYYFRGAKHDSDEAPYAILWKLAF